MWRDMKKKILTSMVTIICFLTIFSTLTIATASKIEKLNGDDTPPKIPIQPLGSTDVTIRTEYTYKTGVPADSDDENLPFNASYSL